MADTDSKAIFAIMALAIVTYIILKSCDSPGSPVQGGPVGPLGDL